MTNETGNLLPRLLLVDGHAQAYRAFHAIKSLSSPEGKPTNAIYGFIKMLDKMRGWLQPKHLAVVWDGGLAAERLAILPEYKAQRPSMPGDLEVQLDEIQAYLAAAGIPSYTQTDIEADDLIATMARCAVAWSGQVIIASADKDFMQLVCDRIRLVNPNDKPPAVWSESEVEKRVGVRPEQVVDWLSLIGDKVDNIPGVSGIGPKTATKLLSQFGSIANLYMRLEEVESITWREKLSQAETIVRRNQAMIRLRDDLRCESGEEAFRLKEQTVKQLADLYRKWGFKTLGAAPETAEQKAGMRQSDFFL